MKRKPLIAVMLSTLLLGTACGDDGGDDTGTGAAPTATAGQPAGDPFVLGVVGSYTGAQAGSIGLVDDATRVWEQHINAAASTATRSS